MMDSRVLSLNAERLGIVLDEQKASSMVTYGENLLIENKTTNLTAITDEEEFLNKHLCDSLTVASLPELTGRVADVGTGGGLPGVIIKLFRDELDVLLVDSTEKKLKAVTEICKKMDIRVETLHQRAEKMGICEYRDYFDSVTARAVARLPQLLEFCLPLLKTGGFFLAMKGVNANSEIQNAKRAASILSGKLYRTVSFKLPGGYERVIAVYKKTGPTPKGFPRETGMILRKPL